MQIMTKHQYNLNGLFLTLVGIGAFAFGISMFMSPKQVINANAIKGEKFTQCQSAAALANMSAALDVVGNKITIISNDLSNFKSTLASASFVISECDGFIMKEMCLGDSCSTSGFVMDLSYSDQAKVKQSAVQVKLKDVLKK